MLIGLLRALLGYVIALVIGAVFVTLAATQINLASLSALGAEISLGVRIDAFWRDLQGFGLAAGVITAVGFAIAFPIAALISRTIGGLRTIGYMLAGAAAVIAAFLIIQTVLAAQMDSTVTLIAPMRSLLGLLAMSIGGAAGGLAFAQLTPSPEARRRLFI